MKNIETLRKMDPDQLAEFLTASGATVPAEFCDNICTGSCDTCGYTGTDGDRRAWREWLESEYDREEKEDGQEPQEPEKV